jgi:hypothetical protein
MITVSNSDEVKGAALIIQNLGRLIEADIERELLRAGADAVIMIIHRVKNQGLDAAGRSLDTKSSKRNGAYSKRYAGLRLIKGRQIARVDLNMTGKMLLDFHLTERTTRSVGVGFLSDGSGEIARYLEEYYGEEIFVPSVDEENFILDDAMVRIEKLMDNL